jgi:septum formation protein
VLAADTIVVLGDAVFGKPRDEDDARAMLRALSGCDHWVYTGICLLSAGKKAVDLAATKVSFLPLSVAELDEYVRSGEPMDKAGAYAIQGLASRFISGIEGSYSNVVGLPVSLVYRHLKTFWDGR